MQPTPKEKGVLYVLSFRAEYLYKSFVILLHGRFVSSLFINLCIVSAYTHACLFYNLDYNPILLYFAAHIVPALAIWSSFN